MKHLHRFFSSDASGGIILIIAAILAMIMANSGATSGWYHDFLETPVQLRVGSLEINKNMLLWINDALMAVFFLLVGLEVKRELMQGSLASLRQAAFPVIAAIGGMIVPALLYLAFNYADPITREGWAIPAATDIAFALGVLALLGSRVPLALKIFLMALASNCGTRGIESVWCTPHGRLYSGWRSVVDCSVEIGGSRNPGGGNCRLLYSFEREAWAFSSEATGACVAPVGGVSDFTTVCIC